MLNKLMIRQLTMMLLLLMMMMQQFVEQFSDDLTLLIL